MRATAIQWLRLRLRRVPFRRLLFAALGALLLLVWLGGVAQLWFERRSYLALAGNTAESLSLALAEYSKQSLENIDNTLQDITRQAARWRDPAQRAAGTEYLRWLAQRHSNIHSIRLYDAEGRAWLDSDADPAGWPSVKEREDFAAHRTGTEPGLQIGMPELGPGGEWRYPLSHRLAGPRGEFAGMAVAYLNGDTFLRFFTTLDVGQDGLVVLLRRDSVLLLRRPHINSVIGPLRFNAIIPALAARAPKGAFTFTSQVDHVERIGYYRTIAPYPLIASVSISTADALAPWRRLVAQFAAILSVITAAVILLGWVMARQHARSERAEARARERQRQLESISLNMPAVVFQRVRRPDGHSYYAFVDPKIRDVFGVEPEEARRGVAALEAVTWPEDVAGIRESFERSARELSMWRHEFRIEPPGKGLQWLRGAATPRPGPAGEVIWDGVFFNITVEKQAEEHLRQVHRMETVGQLSSGVAHQFNNLLMSIQGHLELIQLECGAQHPAASSTTAALDAVQRGATLTRQLLAFSRKQRLEPTAFNLNEALREITELLRGLLGRDIHIDFALQEDLPGVRVDRGLFQTAIVALALNAKEAMPKGGTLALSTALEDFSGEQAPGGPATAGRYIAVRVRDTGLGMPEDVQARAFEPFFTTKGLGLGLGLSQVHGFMKQSGGYAALRSQPQQGTEVALYFPAGNGRTTPPAGR
jgi:signal transduction histidine kinase